MRHLKPVCVTEMDNISISVTTEKIPPFLISGRHLLADSAPFILQAHVYCLYH